MLYKTISHDIKKVSLSLYSVNSRNISLGLLYVAFMDSSCSSNFQYTITHNCKQLLLIKVHRITTTSYVVVIVRVSAINIWLYQQ